MTTTNNTNPQALWETLRALVGPEAVLNVESASESCSGLFGVWLFVEGTGAGGDLVGAGPTEAEALQDAVNTVRAWGGK